MSGSDQQNPLIKLLEKMHDKLEGMDSRLDSVDKTLIKQEVSLAEHIRRTEIAELQISKLDSDLEPIKKHVAYIEGVLKSLGILATVVGIGSALIKFLI